MSTFVGSPGRAVVWSAEYWAKKGDVKLYVYRKRLLAPDDSQPALPVLFLVHGSSASGRSSFDLQVPAREYSLMDHFAALGYDVWTMDAMQSFMTVPENRTLTA